MNTFLQQLRAFHDQLDAPRRRVLYAALAVAAITVVGVGIWAGQPSLAEVARPTSADELADVTTSLAQAGVDYEVDPVTRRVSVPSAARADALRAITAEPADASSSNPFPTPDQERYTQTVARQKALERTINAFEGVVSSKVHLNLPVASPFFKDDQTATASVLVRAEPGVVLSPKLGRTIARTVSGANEKMSLYDVSVNDASGRELWPGDMDNEEGGGLTVQAARRESELSRGLLASLSTILGSAEDLTVSVSVELETATRQQTVKQFDPNSGVTTEETIKSEKTGARAAEGAPGSDSNLPDVTTTSGTPTGRASDSTVTRFDYSNTLTTTNEPAGGVRRLSASVLINSTAIRRVLGTAEGQAADEAAATALKADIEEATRAALGFDATRGDQVVVKFVKFAETPVEPVVPPTFAAQAEPYAPAAIGIVALAVVLLGVVRPLLKMVRPAPAGGIAGAAGEPVMVMGPDGRLTPAANSPMPEEPGETSVDLMERLRNYIENYQAVTPGDLSDLVRRETVHSAEVVRRWIRG